MRNVVLGFMGSLLLLVGACGGKVVVESTGAAGVGGSGGVGGVSTGDTGNGGFIASTGDVSPVGVVSSSTGGPGDLCAQVCAKQQANGCGPASTCVTSCEQTYASVGMCKPQLDALVQCLITTGDTSCKNPSECDPELQAYMACSSPATCGPTSCSVSNDGTCDCQSDCNGAKLEVQCQPGNATDFCVCLKDGMPINKCPQPQGTGLSCDIVKGCCGASFFP